jgi:hypothetical protein
MKLSAIRGAYSVKNSVGFIIKFVPEAEAWDIYRKLYSSGDTSAELLYGEKVVSSYNTKN